MSETSLDTTIAQLFDQLWRVYSRVNPSVTNIRSVLLRGSPSLQNDHIALRTLKHPQFGKDALIKEFLDVGYEVRGHYQFKAKRLDAVHLENVRLPSSPKVFISELLLEDCSGTLRSLVEKMLIAKVQPSLSKVRAENELLSASGPHWGQPSYAVYKALADTSEYAAWFYVFGFVPNHFTVKINSLEQFQEIHHLNEFLLAEGFEMNTSGGLVKGSPELYLEQSSTMADKVEVQFEEGVFAIPSVFYEFAKRYAMPDGKEFSAFIEGNADKIFESTNSR